MVEGRGVPPCSLLSLVLGSLPCGARSGFVMSRWQPQHCRAGQAVQSSSSCLSVLVGSGACSRWRYVRVHLPEHGCMATSCVLVLLGPV